MYQIRYNFGGGTQVYTSDDYDKAVSFYNKLLADSRFLTILANFDV